MEERIGKRINIERIDEALATGPDTVSTACPYCLVMLGDAIAAKKASGDAPESLEIVDVAQLLARSVQPAVAARSSGNSSASAGAPAADGESPQAGGSPAAGSPSGDGQPPPTSPPPAGG